MKKSDSVRLRHVLDAIGNGEAFNLLRRGPKGPRFVEGRGGGFRCSRPAAFVGSLPAGKGEEEVRGAFGDGC